MAQHLSRLNSEHATTVPTRSQETPYISTVFSRRATKEGFEDRFTNEPAHLYRLANNATTGLTFMFSRRAMKEGVEGRFEVEVWVVEEWGSVPHCNTPSFLEDHSDTVANKDQQTQQGQPATVIVYVNHT